MTETEKLNYASQCINTGKYAEAYEILQPFLQEGHASAQYLMGFMHHKGYHVSKDLKKAEEYYLKSCEQGLAVSYGVLGTLYYETQQMEKAYKCFVEGARLHDKTCINNGKFMLKNKQGVLSTEEEEARWQLYEAYYDNDMPRLMTDIYYTAWKFSPEFGEELVDFYYYKAKYENDLKAMFTLACAYKNGKGTAQKTNKAVYWFKKLVENDPKHGLAWMSLYELNEISAEELVEKLKEIDDKNLLKEAKERFNLIIETDEKVSLSIDEEIKLIDTLYKEKFEFAFLQVREFCRKHNNIDDLRRLKEALYTVLEETSRDLKLKVVIDIYWVADALGQLGDESANSEKRAIKFRYSVDETVNAWHDTHESEGEYLYEDDGKCMFMDRETFELYTLSTKEVKPYLTYLQEGDKVKLHFLRFGSFFGIVI